MTYQPKINLQERIDYIYIYMERERERERERESNHLLWERYRK